MESVAFLKLQNTNNENAYFKSMGTDELRKRELKLLSYAFKVATEGAIPYINKSTSDPLLISEANSIAVVYDSTNKI